MTEYVIHKMSRAPGDISYNGATWDRASLRDRYQERYTNKKEAEHIAILLGRSNPVGFCVTRIRRGIGALKADEA